MSSVTKDQQTFDLSYDQLMELIVDIDTCEPMNRLRPLILTALRELAQRRTDERIANNLALARIEA